MLKQSCMVCRIVGAIAIIGALNWATTGIFGVNFIEKFLGYGRAAKLAYGLVGLSGLALLASFFVICPACKKA